MALQSAGKTCARRAVLLAALAASSAALSACVGQLPPQGVKLLNQVAQAYREGDYRETVAKANDFVAIYGGVETVGEAYYLRGLAHARLKDRARAKQDFEQALRLSRRSDLTPLAHVALGNLAFEQGRWSPAAEYYEHAVERLPNESPKDVVLYRLGLCHARQGRWRAGRTWFSQLMHLFPGSALESLARRYFAADGFTIQCGAYRNYANAERQVKDLRRRGLPARRVQDARMRYHLVQVGRYGSYQQARTALAKVVAVVPDAIIVP